MVISSTLVSGTTYDLGIEPVIRMSSYIGQSVSYTNPKGVFMLNSSSQAMWSTSSKALLSDITLDMIEVFS
jgi:hypothetical protein